MISKKRIKNFLKRMIGNNILKDVQENKKKKDEKILVRMIGNERKYEKLLIRIAANEKKLKDFLENKKKKDEKLLIRIAVNEKKLKDLQENQKKKDEKLLTRLTANERKLKDFQKGMVNTTDRFNVLAEMVREIMNINMNYTPQHYNTSHENVWSTDHGFRYVIHHMSEDWKVTRVPLWKMFLKQIPEIMSACEYGCNIGANLKTLHYLKEDIALAGVDINPQAVNILQNEDIGDIKCDSIITVNFQKKFDLVFIRGVLIHLDPNEIHHVMNNIVSHANKYVIIMENYSSVLYKKPNYNLKSKAAEKDEGYQFWDDYSKKFHDIYPDWTIVETGVNLNIGQKPELGDLHWTIFKCPTS